MRKLRGWLCLFLALALLGGCARRAEDREPEYQKYAATWFDCFDTVIALTAYASSEAEFEAAAQEAHELFRRLHKVFDRYHEWPGVAGVWAVNHAGGAAVRAEGELMEALRLCARYYERAGGKVDVTMGTLFGVWHDYREAGVSEPGADVLAAARAHGGMELLALDEDAGTVTLSDPEATLDLGAVGKGYAAEKVGELLAARLPSFLLDAGGNVVAGGAPADGREAWSIGVQDPFEAGDILVVLSLAGVSAVTSGGYQRYYEVDGVRYHHLIDPDTMYPARECAQATVIADSSALADFLSTAAFILPLDEARSMIEAIPGVECLWVQADGTQVMTDGFSGYLRR